MVGFVGFLVHGDLQERNDPVVSSAAPSPGQQVRTHHAESPKQPRESCPTEQRVPSGGGSLVGTHHASNREPCPNHCSNTANDRRKLCLLAPHVRLLPLSFALLVGRQKRFRFLVE